MRYLLILLLPSVLFCLSNKHVDEEFPLIQPIAVEFAPKSTDTDKDHILDQFDKCPNTPLGYKVGKDGCALKAMIVLVQGNKQNTSIIVSTQAGSVTIDEVDQYVTIASKNKPPSKPQKIQAKELNSFFGMLSSKAQEKKLRYTLYFNDLDLNSESSLVLQNLLNELQKMKNPSIKIIGHTDTMGSLQKNYTLGLQRAQSIAQIIKDTGIHYLNLEVDSYSEVNLAIQTEDEVKEQLNRRVEVFIQ